MIKSFETKTSAMGNQNKQLTHLHSSNYPGCFWQEVWLQQHQEMMVTAWNCHVPDFPSIIHDMKARIQLGVSGWWFFSWRKDLFVKYVFANNKEITVQALLPWQPPIVDWDRKAGSSQNVTDCVVEDGTCIEVDCGGTLKLENCFWATDGVCSRDGLCDRKR